MKISEVKDTIGANVLVGEEFMDLDVFAAFGSDLMSDVMAFVRGNVLLLTGLINPQVIRTAEMMDIKAIVFVRGKNLDEGVLKLAKEKEMVVLATQKSMYETCGRLYQTGLPALNIIRGNDEHK